MTYTPGLWVPVCAEGRRGGAQPAFGWIHPILARAGHGAFFSNAIAIAQTWHPPVAFIANLHGLQTAKYHDGRYFDASKEQDFEAYTIAKRAGILQATLMDNDELLVSLARLDGNGCEPIPYVGPWMRKTDPTRDAVQEALEPYIGTVVKRIMVDGGGCRDDRVLNKLIMDCGFGVLMEPQAQQRTNAGAWLSENMRLVTSLTLNGTLRDRSGFYKEYPQDVARYWLDDTDTREWDEAYWQRYDAAIAEGFSPILPAIRELWGAWEARCGNNNEGKVS